MLSTGSAREGRKKLGNDAVPAKFVIDKTLHGVDMLPEKSTFRKKLMRTLKISLPHVGLVTLVTIYTICGAGIFHLIELSHEEQVRSSSLKTIAHTKASVLAQLWNVSQSAGILEEQWKPMAVEKIQTLEIVLYKAYDEQYITMNDIMNKSSKTVWTLPQAIFFATTVLTTIGYGNMVPRTVSGKVLCIVFGIFGIPLLMITIADIGKFLSDFITFQYRQYKLLKIKLRKHSRYFALNDKKANDLEKDGDSVSESSSESTEVHLPVVMAMLVLISYTALGGLLFQTWEGWDYFDAFYFCFITMATIGFGDIVPSEQVYLFFTIIYIVVGLALTTMCIDLAGSEYITKLHYFGQKIETARDVFGGAVVSGLHVGEQIFKHNAFIRTTGGKLIQIGDPETLNKRQASFLRHKFGLPDDYDFTIIAPMRSDDTYSNAMLFAPISPEVLRVVKGHVKLKPDEISESDAYIVQNRTYNRCSVLNKRYSSRRSLFHAGHHSKSRLARRTQLRQDRHRFFLIAPFVFKESKV